MDTVDPTAPVTETPSPAQSDPDAWLEQDTEINCTNCGQPITHPRYQAAVDGQFYHAVVNPAGLLFEIGCFSRANGCRHIGPESDDFSWFDGYVWQVAICAGCTTHLGWHFWSPNGDFYGLILNKLC